MEQGNQIQPAFAIEKVDGKVLKTVVEYDPKAKEKGDTPFKYVDKEVDGGYIVAMPNGSSIRVDKAEAERLGFLANPAHVNMDTGEVIPQFDNSPMARLKRSSMGPLVNTVDDTDKKEAKQ